MKPTLYFCQQLLRAIVASIAVFLLTTAHACLIESAKAQIASSNGKEGDEELAKSELKLCQNLQPVYTLKGHLGGVTVLAKTSDDNTLLTGSEDGSIKIWDLESGVLKASFNEHVGSIESIKTLPDGKTVLSIARWHSGREIKRWNSKTKEIIYSIEIETEDASYRDVRVSKDGKIFITRGDSGDPIRLFETLTGKKIHEIKIPEFFDEEKFGYAYFGNLSISLHLNNRYLLVNAKATESERDIVWIWDLNSSGKVRQFLDFKAVFNQANHSFLLYRDSDYFQAFQWEPGMESAQQIEMTKPEFENQHTKKEKRIVSDLYIEKFSLNPNFEEDFIQLSATKNKQRNCIFPLTGSRAHQKRAEFLTITRKNQVIIANNQFVEVLEVSDICIPKENKYDIDRIDKLYKIGLRQLEEGVFEAAEITFANVFSLSHAACDLHTQVEALFYLAEARFLAAQNMLGSGLNYTKLLYEFARDNLPNNSDLRAKAVNRLKGESPNEADKNSFDEFLIHEDPISYLKKELSQAVAKKNQLEEAHILRALGQVYHRDTIEDRGESSYKNALNFLQQALNLYKRLNHLSGQAAVYHDIGDLQRRIQHYQEASNAYQLAYQLYQQTEETEKIPLLLLYLADVFYILDQDNRALETYSEVVRLCRDVNGDCLNYNGQIFFFRAVGEALTNIGKIYLDRQDYEQALNFSKQSPTMDGIHSIALAYTQQGNYSEALLYFQKIAKTPKDVYQCGGYGAPERTDASIADNLRRRISEEEQTDADIRGCIVAMVNALLGQAEVYRLSENYSQAIAAYKITLQAILYGENVDLSDQKAVTNNNLGLTYKKLGRYDGALHSYQQSLSIRQQEEDLWGQAIVLSNMGEIYRHQGRYAEAKEVYQKALAFFEQDSDVAKKASILHNLGVLYDELGQPKRALDSYQQALTLRQSINDWRGQSQTLNNMGLVYQTLEQFEAAESAYQTALALSQQQADHSTTASTLNNLALFYIASNRSERSLELLTRALAIYRKAKNPVGEGNTLDSLGTAYASLGQYPEAVQSYQAALFLLRKTGSRALEHIILKNLGQLYQRQGESELAILFYKQSVAVTESIRQALTPLPVEDRKTYTETVADTYRQLATLLLEKGRIPEAQQVLDLLKLEELREFTGNTRATWTGSDLAYSDAEQAVIEDHTSLIAFSSKIIDCQATNCKELSGLYDQLDDLKADYDAQVTKFVATVRANRAEDDIFQNPDNLSGEAEELLRAYNANGQKSVLIYPFVLDDKLWLVWATAGRVIGSVEVSVSQKQLAQTVQQLGEQLQSPLSRLADLQASSQQLYDWIVKPLEQELQANEIQHLVFVNDRVTRYIPMAVLYDGQQYLLEHYTLSTVLAPGLTDTDDRLASVDRSQVLGLGLTEAKAGFNPLPGVKEELDGIVRSGDADPKGIYPGQVHLDDAFNLETLKTRVLTHRVLHVATHAAFVPGRAEESFVLLGDGSKLKPAEIEAMEHRLSNLHLVVLSACQTALGGAAGDGTEIAGISSYFLEKGRAETVVASLWLVNDASTSLMMQRFYRLLASGELSKAEALQQAQLSLLYGEDSQARLAAARAGARPQLRQGANAPAVKGYRHPYYWAPFILIGNGL